MFRYIGTDAGAMHVSILGLDGQCLLCGRLVLLLLRHDRRGVLRFASIRGATGRAILAQAQLQPDKLQTLLLVDGPRVWQQTAALMRIAHVLGGPWRLAWLAWLVPAPMRDGLYRLLARNRQRWFGASTSCMVPPPHLHDRFPD